MLNCCKKFTISRFHYLLYWQIFLYKVHI